MVLLPCSHCTIMQSPTPPCYVLHPHAQSCSHHPPMPTTITQAPTSHVPIAQSCSHCPPASNAQPCSHCPPASTAQPCSHCPPASNAQLCSHQPPMIPMHDHAVTNLPCSQQSCSHHPPPMIQPLNNQAVATLPCSQQSCGHQPPMFPTIMQSPTSHVPNNYAVTTLPSLGTRPSLAEEEES